MADKVPPESLLCSGARAEWDPEGAEPTFTGSSFSGLETPELRKRVGSRKRDFCRSFTLGEFVAETAPALELRIGSGLPDAIGAEGNGLLGDTERPDGALGIEETERSPGTGGRSPKTPTLTLRESLLRTPN